MIRYIPGRNDWREAARRELRVAACLGIVALAGLILIALLP